MSSEGQVQTDYSRDGLSITAQREAAEDKAAQLDAGVVGEWTDPGRSAFREFVLREDGWAYVPRWEPLLRDFITLANKLEYLGFTYSNGRVIIIDPIEEQKHV